MIVDYLVIKSIALYCLACMKMDTHLDPSLIKDHVSVRGLSSNSNV